MKNDDVAYLLALWRAPNIGPVKFAEILREEISVKNYLEKSSINIDWKLIEADLKWAESPNRVILSYQDDLYPQRLKEISSSPPILFVEGDISLLSKPQIAIVGSRSPTAGGLDIAHQFAKTFAQNGLIITSGLALGIDAACHEGTLEAKGKTIAVMATGPDQIYPKRHQALAKKISENGCLITEFPTGVTPIAMNFPRRNRIISGLSLGVLVVEAAYASGSLVTARYALEQNREVFAIPGSIHNPLARGCHALIQQGAKLVETAQDVLEELQDFASLPPSIKEEKNSHPFLKNIDFNPTPMDLIIERSALTAEEVSSILLLLELEGHVKSVPGGYQRVN